MEEKRRGGEGERERGRVEGGEGGAREAGNSVCGYRLSDKRMLIGQPPQFNQEVSRLISFSVCALSSALLSFINQQQSHELVDVHCNIAPVSLCIIHFCVSFHRKLPSLSSRREKA